MHFQGKASLICIPAEKFQPVKGDGAGLDRIQFSVYLSVGPEVLPQCRGAAQSAVDSRFADLRPWTALDMADAARRSGGAPGAES